MNRSDKRILTTHVGSLPRPASLVAAYCDEPGSPKLAAVLKESVRDVVQKQLDSGIDVIDDGEFGKPVHGEVDFGAWMTYLASRMQGFEIRQQQTGMFPGKDREDFHDFYCTHAVEIGEIRPVEVVCTGPVTLQRAGGHRTGSGELSRGAGRSWHGQRLRADGLAHQPGIAATQ